MTVPLKEVQPLTGYVRGGVTVLGAKKAYPVYVDETMELFEVVSSPRERAGCKSCWRRPSICGPRPRDSGRLLRWSDGGLAQVIRLVPRAGVVPLRP